MQPSNSPVLDFHYNNQSYVKDEKEGIHVSPLIRNGPLTDRIEGASTLYDVFKNSVGRQPNDPFLGWHDSLQAPYQWWTYEQVNEKVEACGSGLLELPELVQKSVKCVGIYAINCPAWKIVQLGCWAYGMVVVPLYDTLGQKAIGHIFYEAEVTVAICDTTERAEKLIKARANYPELKYIVLVSAMGDLEHLQTSAAGDIEIILFDDLLAFGSANLKPVRVSIPVPLFSLSVNIYYLFKPLVYFSLMMQMKRPLFAIPAEQQMHLICVGGRIGFYSGNIANLYDDMRVLRPTYFAAVPQMLCRIFDSVYQEAAKSPLKRFLLNFAIKEKCHQVDRQVTFQGSLYVLSSHRFELVLPHTELID
ncbi:hypothetical protein Aperf_G00000011844 [Anoplocephala perfoliata]